MGQRARLAERPLCDLDPTYILTAAMVNCLSNQWALARTPRDAMAGHSKWANIRFRKGAQDARRGKLFTKIGRAHV